MHGGVLPPLGHTSRNPAYPSQTVPAWGGKRYAEVRGGGGHAVVRVYAPMHYRVLRAPSLARFRQPQQRVPQCPPGMLHGYMRRGADAA